jgi:hypothetical protein
LAREALGWVRDGIRIKIKIKIKITIRIRIRVWILVGGEGLGGGDLGS